MITVKLLGGAKKSFSPDKIVLEKRVGTINELIAHLIEIKPKKQCKPPEKKKEIKTPHHIAYEIATAKYNPFSVGGSESIHDFEGGSENHVK